MQLGWGTLSEVEGAQVDIARTAVHAFAFGNDVHPRPVHITRITSFFRRYFPNRSALESLHVLSLLKEVIALPEGMWLPGASRVIPLMDSSYLVIAPQPSTELSRIVGNPVFTRLYGRFSSNPIGAPFERQTLIDWNERYTDLTIWTKAVLSTAKARLQSTLIGARTVEVCRVWASTGDPSKSGSRWQKVTDKNVVPNGMYLCKEFRDGSATRYFLGDFFKNDLVRESSLSEDPIRLRFGLEGMSDRSIFISPEISGSTVEIELWRRLPESELMVVAALTTKIESTKYGARLSFDKTSFPVISSTLAGLGIRVLG